MLLVKTALKPSSIQGNGLFAAERICAGRVIWTFSPGLDVIFRLDAVESLPATVRGFLDRFSIFDHTGDYLIVCLDDARFINHSSFPNTRLDEDCATLTAAVDIEPGEEITEKYSSTDWDRSELATFSAPTLGISVVSE
jgi:SET domain-containing protein